MVATFLDPARSLHFFAQASAVVAGAEDVDAALQEVVQAAVPDLADWCTIDILDAEHDGHPRQILSVHPDARMGELLMELRRRFRAETGRSEGVAKAMDSKAPVLYHSHEAAGPLLELSDAERALYEDLHPQSTMILPLTVRGRSIGALTFLSCRPGRLYGSEDVALMEDLASRLALLIDHARLKQAAESTVAQLDSLYSSAPIGLGLWDRDLRIVRLNEFLAALNGRPRDEHLGLTVPELLPPELADRLAADSRRVLESGLPLRDLEMEVPVRVGPPHAGRTYRVSLDPVAGPGGEVTGVAAVVQDVTSERLALRRASFLARAGEILDGSLDYEETLQNVAELAVPSIADWCGMHMLEPDGTLKLVAVRHADPDKVQMAWDLNRFYPSDPEALTGAANVVRTGVTEYRNEIPDEMLVQAAVDAEHLRLVRGLGMRAYVVAPLVARDVVVGVLTLIGAETKVAFTPEDVQLAEDLGRRAGLSIENARLYTERVRIAHTLQTRLLPDRLPDVPGIEMAARYTAAGELLEVGGDFYDVCAGTDGSTVLFVGDVSGKGAEAAAATAMARFTLRAAAHSETSPARMLSALNEAMDQDGQFCTVALARLCDGVMTLSLGGHPPAYVLHADGTVEEAGRYGTVIGSIDEAIVHDLLVPLVPGDTVLLYTDGVIEGGSALGALGEEGLICLLEDLVGEDVNTIVDSVVAGAIEVQDGVPRDDIAVLAFRFTG